LAAFCSVPVPPQGERVYSITFRHNREEWTATVGRLLTGTKTWIRWRKPGVKLSSPQLVIAIFDGHRAMVVTDCWPFGTSRSEWANPFKAGVPIRVEYFTE
jgi:hypothetical protein